MDIKVFAPRDRAITLALEPWGELFEINAGGFLRLEVEGSGLGPLEVAWSDDGLTAWPPSGSAARVFTPSGEAVGEERGSRPSTP
jgi:hypothetical protein